MTYKLKLVLKFAENGWTFWKRNFRKAEHESGWMDKTGRENSREIPPACDYSTPVTGRRTYRCPVARSSCVSWSQSRGPINHSPRRGKAQIPPWLPVASYRPPTWTFSFGFSISRLGRKRQAKYSAILGRTLRYGQLSLTPSPLSAWSWDERSGRSETLRTFKLSLCACPSRFNLLSGVHNSQSRFELARELGRLFIRRNGLDDSSPLISCLGVVYVFRESWSDRLWTGECSARQYQVSYRSWWVQISPLSDIRLWTVSNGCGLLAVCLAAYTYWREHIRCNFCHKLYQLPGVHAICTFSMCYGAWKNSGKLVLMAVCITVWEVKVCFTRKPEK